MKYSRLLKVSLLGLVWMTCSSIASAQTTADSDLQDFNYQDLPYWAAPPVIEFNKDWFLFQGDETHLVLSYAQTDHHDESEELSGFDVGLHHYFNRFLGLGADYLYTGGQFHENVATGTVRVRIPFDEASLAVFLLAGGGASFGGSEGSAACLTFGAGLEIRLLESVSLIGDVRAIEPTSETDLFTFQVGLSFIF
jgi:hypothetical protein